MRIERPMHLTLKRYEELRGYEERYKALLRPDFDALIRFRNGSGYCALFKNLDEGGELESITTLMGITPDEALESKIEYNEYVA